METIYKNFIHKVKQVVKDKNIYTKPIETLAYGTDASFYRLIPKIVIKSYNENEVQNIIKLAEQFKLPITFRAAGTSLSGQAITDSILLKTALHWDKIEISQDKKIVTLGPSVIGAIANAHLAQYGKKIGPDPASINAAMIGGIAANNASGMCCGVAENTYKTVKRMKIIFSDGYILDTGNKENVDDFLKIKKEFVQHLLDIRNRIHSDNLLLSKISEKFKIKNTTGYSLNSFVDFIDPIEIIQHLLVGSEGTLGFISEITLYTVDDNPFKASSLMLFYDTKTTCDAVIKLKLNCKVDAVELMDRAALRSVENEHGIPEVIKTLPANACSILVQVSGESKQELNSNIEQILSYLSDFKTIVPISFTDIPDEYNQLWKIRKGIFPAVGGMRKIGTTTIIEDVAFPIKHLADGTLELQELFKKHGYYDAVIFGHALEGNLHFVFNQDFNDAKEIKRYADFIDDITQMVVNKYNGSLKAEHGTGRNMAPFVELEWGEKAFSIMKEIKQLFDPNNILNPGVIINDDNNIHLKNLKPMPTAHELIDKCIECGFCESNCPSKDLTLTPRQRIVITRELQRLDNLNDKSSYKNILKDYDYYFNQTCATDGLCQLACPVHIDTGKFVKFYRHKNIKEFDIKIANYIKNNFDKTTKTIATLLSIIYPLKPMFNNKIFNKFNLALNKISNHKISVWNKFLPKGNKFNKHKTNNFENIVIYFPSCISRTFGTATRTELSQTEIMLKLLNKAHFNVLIPNNVEKLCCGMPFASKGYFEQGDLMAKELYNELLQLSNNGKYPILFDTSPCIYRLYEFAEKYNLPKIKIYEPFEFTIKYLKDKLIFNKTQKSISIHITCSSKKLNLDKYFIELANLCSDKVLFPKNVGCCGTAGDRGFTYPELNNSALIRLKSQIEEHHCECGYSNSRTCEIGISQETGIEYKSVLYLVDEVTQEKN
ncbi:MAG TPA: FAD-binding and (Fe-S)-binding domain-containing protein [Ignavibacteriales bacterium]|nr:FAD-binding and (Fe-S)-binding domain-containing protein [Ignavibacteriales bacterium]HPD67419.1 FAD-binding and (Fe-S)-binding domain-containing protein [Ignavibacteriales bacterium]